MLAMVDSLFSFLSAAEHYRNSFRYSCVALLYAHCHIQYGHHYSTLIASASVKKEHFNKATGLA